MNCERINEEHLLRGLLNGTLGEDVKGQLKEHVAGCTACRLSLQMTASLMLQPEVSPVAVPNRVVEPGVSLWQRVRERLFPDGMGWLQPAVAFAAVTLVALPVLNSIWMPADPDVNGNIPAVRSVDNKPMLSKQLPKALKAFHAGEPEEAFELLKSEKVNWNDSPMELVYVAHRLRGQAAHQLGWNDAALQDLNQAQKYTELEPARIECLKKDQSALQNGSNDFCALPVSMP